MKPVIYLSIVCLMTLVGCRSSAPLHTIGQLDVQRYSGTWYEIARITHRFERGLKKVSATYTVRNDGKITVLNRGSKDTDPEVVKTAKGIAWIPDPTKPAQLKVRFFWPFTGNYWIIDLDADYRHALIGDPSRKYLWILSRTKTMDAATYNRLTDIAAKAGFDISRLDRIQQ
ncbi:MAG: Outer rane lipoprotein Blc [Bacteroidetes bacterium]|nr:Outer rane lipoprotein Blc [Bacteroidota bacterium]